MVESKTRKVLYFLAFVLPCLVLYILFFITPFVNGIGISLTNWDGLTPKSPISMSRDEFETSILGKLNRESDRDYLLSVYEFNAAENKYSRLSLSGLERRKVERIIRKTDYEPANYRFVGLENYIRIFTGKVDTDFYPHSYTQVNYNKTSDLPSFIEAKTFDKDLLSKCSVAEKERLLDYYAYSAERKRYELAKQYSQFDIESMIWELPEVVTSKTLSETAVDSYISRVNTFALSLDIAGLDSFTDEFLAAHEFTANSAETVKAATGLLYGLGEMKNWLSETWVAKKFNMGVVGFTLFFALFSVIGINVLAFLLALALDTKLKGQTVYRSIFFLPNVLSMVIVALIWSMLFVQLLPSLTGIERWISDPAKTPWLLVLVAVWQGAGYYMIVYLAGLQNIPSDVVEASTIDGASALQRFRFITLPLLLPAITISLFLTIANALKSFDLIYAMIGTTGYATGTVPFVMDIYFDAFAQKQAGLATAKAMILFMAIFLITGIQLFVMKRKEIEQ